jgi:hypothetical protein
MSPMIWAVGQHMWQRISLLAIASLSFYLLSFGTMLAQTAYPEITPTEKLAGDKTGKDAIKRPKPEQKRPSVWGEPTEVRVRIYMGVVTLSETSLIFAIEQQAKSLKSHASAFAVVGEFRSI